ncbi:unnamed protein product [Linum tenue]|uniref:Cyanobacterial aminoacyl-tRNA synthetase CAAD domain-containing protein n=1 Tax=Linum tenue TaxID=586396 RepID=A0AAV0PHH5_9ROSI|nr:unnamed protein product [Linum tenue]
MAATMYPAAATAASSTTSFLLPAIPAVRTVRCSRLPLLPPRSSSSRFSPASLKALSESSRVSLLQTRATSSDESSVDTSEIFTDLKEKLPKIMELVGLGYTGWFVYRYLLFKQSRKELATDIETLKKKIAGTE